MLYLFKSNKFLYFIFPVRSQYVSVVCRAFYQVGQQYKFNDRTLTNLNKLKYIVFIKLLSYCMILWYFYQFYFLYFTSYTSYTFYQTPFPILKRIQGLIWVTSTRHWYIQYPTIALWKICFNENFIEEDFPYFFKHLKFETFFLSGYWYRKWSGSDFWAVIVNPDLQ